MDRKYTNETLKLLNERKSIRNFLEKDISSETMSQVYEAGIHAPSGGNLQTFSIIESRDKNVNRKLRELCGNQPWIENAPVNLLFCIDQNLQGRWAEIEYAPYTATKSFRHFWIAFQDTIIAAQNICTAADSLGLGSVYIGTVLECFEELIEMFELPKGVFPVVLLSLGYPKGETPVRKKHTIETLVHKEKYRILDDSEIKSVFDEKFDNIKIPLSENKIENILKVCRNTDGDRYAEEVEHEIRARNYISLAQRIYGLHYVADEMPSKNTQFLDIIRKQGFEWFDPQPDFEE